MSEQIYASVPNRPSSSKDIHGFDEEVDSNQGQQSELLPTIPGWWLIFCLKSITCLTSEVYFVKKRPASEFEGSVGEDSTVLE